MYIIEINKRLEAPLFSRLIAGAASIDAEAFMGDAWGAESLTEHAGNAYDILTAAVDSGDACSHINEECSRVLGYVILRCLEDGEILRIAVSGDRRRQGIGEALLRAAMSEAAGRGAGSVFLEVRSQNQAARCLYAKLGFTEIGVRKRYYSNPADDAAVMKCTLPPDKI